MRNLRSLLFNMAFFSLIATGPALAAFAIEPFILRLDMSSGQTVGWVELTPMVNYRPVPVEIQVFERRVDQNGAEVFDTPRSEDLVVYPSEVLLNPNQKVKVQVSWARKEPPTSDRSYALVFSEVPLPTKTDAQNPDPVARLQTLARFRAVVAIETGKSGQLAVASCTRNGKGKIEILVENRGRGRVPIDGMHLIIRGKKYTKFKGSSGNSVMPGEKRLFEIELPFIPAANEIRYGHGT
jgi:P pilus assembly chaperone PapD